MKPAQRWSLLVALVPLVVAPLPAYAVGLSGFNDKAALEALGFSRLIVAASNTSRVFNNRGQIVPGDDSRIAALFVHKDLLRVLPNAGGAPWFRYEPRGGSIVGDTFVVAVARRQIVSRSNIQQWSEGAKRLYAETIAYSIVPIGDFADLKVSRGLHSIRLVSEYDPAVGRWQVSYRSQAGELSRDAAGFISQVASNGDPYLSALNAKRDQALVIAFNTIEANLAQQGILARDNSDSNILVSRQAGLAYYIKLNDVSRAPPSGGLWRVRVTTLGEVHTFCSNIQTARYRGWHIPSADEMSTIINWVGERRSGTFIDVPDGRLWGEIGRPPLRGQGYNVPYYEFISSSIFDSRGTTYSFYNLPVTIVTPQVVTFDLFPDGPVSRGRGYVGAKTTALIGEAPIETASLFRVICVASTGSKAPESGGVGVQVGAYSSVALAEMAWGKMVVQSSALSGVPYRVLKVQSDIGTIYRLQAVTEDAAAAIELCDKLKAAGQACQVK